MSGDGSSGRTIHAHFLLPQNSLISIDQNLSRKVLCHLSKYEIEKLGDRVTCEVQLERSSVLRHRISRRVSQYAGSDIFLRFEGPCSRSGLRIKSSREDRSTCTVFFTLYCPILLTPKLVDAW